MGDLELSTLLRVLREDAGITQTELSVRINRDRTWISKVEHGREIPDTEETLAWVMATKGGEKFLRELSKALGVPNIGIDTLVQARSVIQMAQIFSSQIGQMAL